MGIINVFGGVFPTFAPELAMKYDEVDMCCVGEGENAIIDLANSISNGDDYSKILQICGLKKILAI